MTLNQAEGQIYLCLTVHNVGKYVQVFPNGNQVSMGTKSKHASCSRKTLNDTWRST